MIELDGSIGEGGGQLLRAALALSVATRQPFRMTRIRAGRAKPGLLRQHLTCVQAAGAVSNAQVEGAVLGSRELAFRPTTLIGGRHEFAIGTAGSTLLVVQALLPALLVAPAPSTLLLSGGTHNSGAPPFEFFARTLAPLLERCGARISARLLRHGFFPAGGGAIEVELQPAPAPAPLELLERGALLRKGAVARRSHLPRTVTSSERDVLLRRLPWEPECIVEEAVDAHGPGNIVLVTLEHERVTEVIASFGEKGRPAESVASAAATATLRWLASEAPVDAHLADQLLVPLALLAGGRFRSGPLCPHATTAIAIIERFLPGAIAVAPAPAPADGAIAAPAGEVEVVIRGRSR